MIRAKKIDETKTVAIKNQQIVTKRIAEVDVLPMNPEGIQGWVPSEPRQNRQVAQNGDSPSIVLTVYLWRMELPETDETANIVTVISVITS